MGSPRPLTPRSRSHAVNPPPSWLHGYLRPGMTSGGFTQASECWSLRESLSASGWGPRHGPRPSGAVGRRGRSLLCPPSLAGWVSTSRGPCPALWTDAGTFPSHGGDRTTGLPAGHIVIGSFASVSGFPFGNLDPAHVSPCVWMPLPVTLVQQRSLENMSNPGKPQVSKPAREG